MNARAFLVAAIGFVAVTLFVYRSYPLSWRQNRLFKTVLILWHAVGTVALITVFTSYRRIPYEGVKYELVRIATFYYIMIMLLAIMFFLRRVSSVTYLFVMEQTGREIDPRQRRFIADKRLHATLFLLTAFLVCATGFFNIDFLHDTRYEVHVAKPSAEKELNICLIADIHAGSGNWQFTYDDLAERIDASNADVLLIAGDAFDETTCDSDVEYLGWALKSIRTPRYGVYYIYGNHDDYTDNWAAEQMKALGATVLEDEVATLGADIQLIGRMDPKHNQKSMEALMEGVDPEKPVVVLTHRPREYQKMADLGCDLAMAGHTHGFNIPQFLGANLLENTYYGLKRYGDLTAITTSGVAAWGFHYKWPAVSEVVSIRVTFDG